MNWIEESASVAKIEGVHSQYDYKMTDNQCSWCAYEFVVNYGIFQSKPDEFNIKKYNSLIEKASEKKKNLSQKICGENINDEILLNEYKDKLTIISNEFIEINSALKDDVISMFPDIMRETFFIPKKEVVDISAIRNTIDEFLPYTKRFMLVNRFGQSFACIGRNDGNMCIVDSHFRTISISDKEHVFNYKIGRAHV